MAKIIKGEVTNNVAEMGSERESAASHTLIIKNDAIGSIDYIYGDIPDQAYYNDTSVEAVIFGTSCKRIGVQAFQHTSGTNVGPHFPNGLKIPSQIVEIGYDAFSGCDRIFGNIEYTNENLQIAGYADSVAFNNCPNITGTVLPSGVTRVPPGAFTNQASVTDLSVLPAGITKLGGAAFRGCTNLTGNLTIPNIELEGEAHFAYCTGINSFIFSEGIQNIPDYFFYFYASSPGALSSLTFPSTLKSIGEFAFTFLSNCSTPTFPNGLESIDKYAFYYCDGFTGTLTIPDSVTNIGERAFYACNINEIIIPNTINLQLLTDCFSATQITSFTIPSSVEILDQGCLRYCYSLSTIDFAPNSSLRAISNNAFESCISLDTIVLPDNVTRVGAFSNSNNFIYYNADEDRDSFLYRNIDADGEVFKNCTSLANLYIGPNLPAENWHTGWDSGGTKGNFVGVPSTCNIYVHPDVYSGYDSDWKTRNEFTGTVIEWTNYPNA